MFARFYNSPDGIKINADLFIFATENLVSLEFTRCWSRAGEFTMVLPFDTDILRKLAVGEIIDYGGNWFMIESLSYDYKRITLSGHDLGIVLSYRVSAYIPDAQEPGTQGYDTVRGTTAQCIEHYINNNFIAPADSERAVPMSFSSQPGAGVYNDRYMARLENIIKKGVILLIIYLIVGLFIFMACDRMEELEKGESKNVIVYNYDK